MPDCGKGQSSQALTRKLAGPGWIDPLPKWTGVRSNGQNRPEHEKTKDKARYRKSKQTTGHSRLLKNKKTKTGLSNTRFNMRSTKKEL